MRKKTEEALKTKNRNRISAKMQDTRDALHHSPEKRRYDEFEKRLTGKHEAASPEESEILERKHAAKTTAVTNDENGARKEETIDSKDQELFALIGRRKIWTEKTRPK